MPYSQFCSWLKPSRELTCRSSMLVPVLTLERRSDHKMDASALAGVLYDPRATPEMNTAQSAEVARKAYQAAKARPKKSSTRIGRTRANSARACPACPCVFSGELVEGACPDACRRACSATEGSVEVACSFSFCFGDRNRTNFQPPRAIRKASIPALKAAINSSR